MLCSALSSTSTSTVTSVALPPANRQPLDVNDWIQMMPAAFDTGDLDAASPTSVD